MNERIEEILKWLEKSQEQQWQWLCQHQVISCGRHRDGKNNKQYQRLFLADLAFRLRDEIHLSLTDFNVIYDTEIKKKRVKPLPRFVDGEFVDGHGDYAPIWSWLIQTAKPIHWIAAALAKEKEDEDTGD